MAYLPTWMVGFYLHFGCILPTFECILPTFGCILPRFYLHLNVFYLHLVGFFYAFHVGKNIYLLCPMDPSSMGSPVMRSTSP